jgi:hypothetical protein
MQHTAHFNVDHAATEVAFACRSKSKLSARSSTWTIHPWRILCESHRNKAMTDTGCANPVEREAQRVTVPGAWTCVECAKFDRAAADRLREAIKSPEFSHVSIRGFNGEIGVVYKRDPSSPSGVRSAGASFDPKCPEAMRLVREWSNGNAYVGPQRGAIAESSPTFGIRA